MGVHVFDVCVYVCVFGVSVGRESNLNQSLPTRVAERRARLRLRLRFLWAMGLWTCGLVGSWTCGARRQRDEYE